MAFLDKLLRRKPQGTAKQNAVPAELWNTPRSGDFLRKLGVSSEGPKGAAPAPRTIASDIEKARQAFERECADINRDIARKFGQEHVLFPFFLAPSSCWNGPHSDLLSVTLALNPYDDWNIELCADNEATARILEAPLLPYREVEIYAEIIEETVAALSARLGPKPDAAARDAAAREIKAVVAGLRGHWVAHCRALLVGKSAA